MHSVWQRFFYIACSIFLTTSTVTYGQEQAPSSDGKLYPVSGVYFSYEETNPGNLPLGPLNGAVVNLVEKDGGFAAAGLEDCAIEIQLQDLCELDPQQLYGSAIVAIAESAVAHLNEMGLIGVFVTVDPKQITETGEDLRKGEDGCLHMVVYTYKVSSVNSMALGDRFCEDLENNPAHAQIVCCSPVAPQGEGVEWATNLLRKDLLNNYLYFLNRYPGRQVDVQLTPSEDFKAVDLDYLVAEDCPMKFFLNATNTGTPATPKWIERIGFTDRQFLGFDDILTAEFSTTRFDGFYAARASYDFPICDYQWIRGELRGRWSDFTADNFGIFNEEFKGKQWGATGGVRATLTQWDAMFLDLIANVDWMHVKVDNSLITGPVKASENFVLPSIGVALDEDTIDKKLYAYVGLRGNLPWLANTDAAGIALLGRGPVPTNFMIATANFYASTYIDDCLPECFMPSEPGPCFGCFWEDDCCEESTCQKDRCSWNGPGAHTDSDKVEPQPKQQAQSTWKPPLTHELSMSLNGQYSFGHRLIPQLQYVIGGMFTVRGYPQSIAGGDSGGYGQLEYHYHRYFCERDWHVMGRAFLDGGWTHVVNPNIAEVHKTLVGTGLGVEVEWKQYIRFRTDWGVALKDIPSEGLKQGRNEFYFSVTVVY